MNTTETKIGKQETVTCMDFQYSNKSEDDHYHEPIPILPQYVWDNNRYIYKIYHDEIKNRFSYKFS